MTGTFKVFRVSEAFSTLNFRTGDKLIKHAILIVDEEINTLKVLAAALKNSKIQVETARSGEEALYLIQKKKYSLVISDFKMGGMSGEDLLEK